MREIEQLADVCTLRYLRAATRVVERVFDSALAPVGVKGSQLIVLAGVTRLQPVTMRELARELVLDPTTLSRSLRPLLRHRLLEVAPGSDRRTKIVTLTPRGSKTVTALLPLWRGALAEISGRLGERWHRDLLRVTRRLLSDDELGRARNRPE